MNRAVLISIYLFIKPIPLGKQPSSDPGYARPTFPLGEGLHQYSTLIKEKPLCFT